jgi:hypothetical protein
VQKAEFFRQGPQKRGLIKDCISIHSSERQTGRMIGLHPMLMILIEGAVKSASQHHRTELRNGVRIPYLSHLHTVPTFVLEHGGSENEAIATLVHHAIENRGDSYAGGRPRLLAYLHHLETASRSVLLASCAVKLHNSQCMVSDYCRDGDRIWDRFRLCQAPDAHKVGRSWKSKVAEIDEWVKSTRGAEKEPSEPEGA